MNHMVAFHWGLGSFLLGSIFFGAIDLEPLRLHIQARSSSEAPIVVVAYAEEAHFLTEKGKVLKGQKKQSNDYIEFVVDQLEPGVYALVVFEDLNSNGLLDQNKLGIPQEPFGFSKAKLGLFGPPSFKKASFEFPAENDIEVQLKNF